MPIFSTSSSRIAGISACIPKNIFDVKDYKWISEKERDQFIKRVGVQQKRIISKGMTTVDLCSKAAEDLLNELKWNREDIGILIFISQTGDYLIPGSSGILQDRLGLSKNCMAFDINLGCTGFVYGLSVITSLLQSSGITKGLLLMGETATLSSYRDKSSFPLMGDAGTAIAIEHDKKAPNMFFNLQTDGSGYDAIMVRDGGARHPVSKDSFTYKKVEKGIIRSNLQAKMDRHAVFQFCMREVLPNIKTLLEHYAMDLDQFDYLVFHQANQLINETLRRKLKVSSNRFPSSLSKYGNTSSATIPLTMVSELRKPLTKKTLKMLVAGFGVGLSWGSAIIDTKKITCPEIAEL